MTPTITNVFLLVLIAEISGSQKTYNSFFILTPFLNIKSEICNMNYFELFEIPVSLQVAKNILSKKYVELQRKSHPDFFTTANEYEQAESLERSSEINKALKVFKNSEETIKYVLQLKGLLEEGEKYQLPPAFLMEMLELNEELSEGTQQQIKEIEAGIYAPVKSIIEHFSDETTTAEDLLKVKDYYYKKKYLQRILDRIDG
jgi:molecular chaperone HscB